MQISTELPATGQPARLTTDDLLKAYRRMALIREFEERVSELYARATGTNQGLGGSMHIADPDLGIFGANGIVAAGVPIAGGAALALRLRKQNNVVVSLFGDGAVAQGALHEATNLAACGSCRSSSSARTTATPSSRRAPTSIRSRSPPAREATGPRPTGGTATTRATRRSTGPRKSCRRGRNAIRS